MNRLQDRLDSLHYNHRVAVFLTLVNTAGKQGLSQIYCYWGDGHLLPFTDMEDPWAFENENFQVIRLDTGGGYLLE